MRLYIAQMQLLRRLTMAGLGKQFSRGNLLKKGNLLVSIVKVRKMDYSKIFKETQFKILQDWKVR